MMFLIPMGVVIRSMGALETTLSYSLTQAIISQ